MRRARVRAAQQRGSSSRQSSIAQRKRNALSTMMPSRNSHRNAWKLHSRRFCDFYFRLPATLVRGWYRGAARAAPELGVGEEGAIFSNQRGRLNAGHVENAPPPKKKTKIRA